MSKATGSADTQTSRSRDLSERRLWFLTAAIAAVGTGVYLLLVRELTAYEVPLRIPVWVLAGLFGLAEIFVIHVHFKREAHSFSLSEIPLVLGLFFALPGELAVAHLVGAGIALAFHRRQPPLKLAFNLSRFFFETCLAVMLFHLMLELGNPLDPVAWVAAYGVTFMVDAVAGGFVLLAISIAEGRPPALPQMLGVGTLATFANTTVGLVSAIVMWRYPPAIWMLVVMSCALYFTYSAYAKVRQKHEAIQSLYESTRLTKHSLTGDSVVLSLLNEAREMCRAEVAEVLLVPSRRGDAALRSALGPGDSARVMQQVELSPTEGVWARVVSEDQALLMPRPIANPRLRRYFASNGLHDVMVAPLRGEDGVVGTLLVGNRRSDVGTFEGEDLQLLETLANHASVSIENVRLLEELRRQAAANEHQALHDHLTDLPNRTLFRDRIRQAVLRAEREGTAAAVMIMDLDRFKEINDTLGHHNGDALLKEIGLRLQTTLRETDTVARLGGDEFAVVLGAIPGREEATSVAAKLLGCLRRPFTLQDIALDVGASVGVALYPDHGADPDLLIQHADVAMYTAKDLHTGYEVYEQERNKYTHGRLALVGELRAAIEERALDVAYQPKVDLVSGRLLGVETLARWNHPRRGPLMPDTFIPVAEHTGLIKPLTLCIVEQAVSQARRWQEDGIELTAAVNLSARNLVDPNLPHDLAAILERFSFEPRCLVVEITESSLMADPVRTETVLAGLSRLGVGISIDDFGTGYSSLSHLKRLPVDEIKIDRSFVLGMRSSENDAVIVRSIVELGRNLGLRVVAEGVEDLDALQRLRMLGCDVAQGFYLSRPMPAARFPEWVKRYELELPSEFQTPLPPRLEFR